MRTSARRQYRRAFCARRAVARLLRCGVNAQLADAVKAPAHAPAARQDYARVEVSGRDGGGGDACCVCRPVRVDSVMRVRLRDVRVKCSSESMKLL